jgi:hypothetical protein
MHLLRRNIFVGLGTIFVSLAAVVFFRNTFFLAQSRAPASDTISYSAHPDRLFYTLNQEQTLMGPFLKEPTDDAQKNEQNLKNYVNKVFRLVLAESHKKAIPLLESKKENKFYRIFLATSLMVPFHESVFVHFREIEKLDQQCRENRNSGEVLKEENLDLFERFKEYFLNDLPYTFSPVIPCDKLQKGKLAFQLLGSYDHLSVGLYQMNFMAHPDYGRSRMFLGVDSTLEFGVRFLYGGFTHLYGNSQNYDCLYETIKDEKTGKSRREIKPEFFIRGLWGGKFNGGNYGKTCRFARTQEAYDEIMKKEDAREREESLDNLREGRVKGHRWAGNDIKFKGTYDSFFSTSSELLRHLDEKNKAIFLDIASFSEAEVPKIESEVGNWENYYRGVLEEEPEVSANAKVEKSETEKADGVSEPKVEESYAEIVVDQTVNVREAPGNAARSLGVFTNGTKVKIIKTGKVSASSQYTWYFVRTLEPGAIQEGWVLDRYVRISGK